MSKIEQVKAAAWKILEDAPEGMRFKDLIQAVRNTGLDWEGLPQYIQWLPERNADTFYKPSRGIFALTALASAAKAEDAIAAEEAQSVDALVDASSGASATVLKESDFYQSFAEYIVNELDECTRAVSLGGAGFGGKWGTPDVIGVTLPRLRDVYKPPLEVLSAEIKIVADSQLITAFGQACSYQLFSHKSYIVVPNDAKNQDLDRLETLCHSFGIGLVTFNRLSSEIPDYRIRVRAYRREPDRFYVNEILSHSAFEALLNNTIAMG
jgi:hypothetical protein